LPKKSISLQIADSIFMVRPSAFEFNAETAKDNFFQQQTTFSAGELQQKALAEFDGMVELLQSKGIHIIVSNDSAEPAKPDAIFPNNWFSTTPDGGIHIFPMQAMNRRLEKILDIENVLRKSFQIDFIKDWSELELQGQFLEGTGSMVMDHENRVIYACISNRTSLSALEQFSTYTGYKVLPFHAENDKGTIYHTNVMMSIGEGFAVLCPKMINDNMERIAVAQLLETTGHENIYVEPGVAEKFACNILQVKNKNGDKFIVMSQTAFDAFPFEKRKMLEKYGEIIPVDVSTIENVNGGSVRCMMAEIFLPVLYHKEDKAQSDTI
jgi:hypothetical protein